ncbi:MAG: hypothetical protein R2851_14150 [Caldilineaceae bacterium]
MVGAHFTYGDGRFQHGASHFPTAAQLLIDSSRSPACVAHRLHDSRLNGRYPWRSGGVTRPFLVDFVLGAAMLVRSPPSGRSAG